MRGSGQKTAGTFVSGCLAALLLGGAAQAALSIIDVRTAKNDVLVLCLRSTQGDHEPPSVSTSDYSLNSRRFSAVNRYSLTHDAMGGTYDKYFVLNHFIYLSGISLHNGESYTLSTPYGDTTFVFDDHRVVCESIHLNQAGYSSLTTRRYANFVVWLGDGGTKKLSETPAYTVFEQHTGETVAAGTLSYFKTDNLTGDEVYRIDLSAVPPGGPYRIAVEGHGASWPFGVGGAFVRQAAYVAFRGLFHQRCGVELMPPYTDFPIRGQCHTTVYIVDQPHQELWSDGDANMVVVGTEPTEHFYGGYHDAGDHDRRGFHILIPILLLGVYEAMPGMFTDGQYNVPGQFSDTYEPTGKLNGIPDILDEIVWGTMIWEQLQLDNGAVRWGIERDGCPRYGDVNAATDPEPYGTYGPNDRVTQLAAGLFMHLARVIRPYAPDYSARLVESSTKAWNYNGSENTTAREVYYHINNYLLNGDEASHTFVRQNATGTGGYPSTYGPITSWSHMSEGMFLPYVFDTTMPKDQAVVDHFRQKVLKAAQERLDKLQDNPGYPRGPAKWGGFGGATNQSGNALPLLMAYRLTGEQQYMDAAAEYLDYLLGLNPLGKPMITGIGSTPIEAPLHIDSYYPKQDGYGPAPGIGIYGPGFDFICPIMSHLHPQSVSPERQWGDGWYCVGSNEFTVDNPMLSHAAAFAMLQALEGGGTHEPGSDPFDSAFVGVQPPEAVRHVQQDLSLRAVGGGTLDMRSPVTAGNASIRLYTLAGELVSTLYEGSLRQGARYRLTVNGASRAPGSYLVRVQAGVAAYALPVTLFGKVSR